MAKQLHILHKPKKNATCNFSSSGVSVEAAGIEPDCQIALSDNNLRQLTDSFGTESGALRDDFRAFPPDLAVIISAWPNLPDAAKRRTLATIEASIPPSSTEGR